ncbi:MAG TPA: hypothetical protein VLK37_05850 [Solirubrobacterales bacterium]|nr:hypothetical protein [Solirubrobacterales bacterium]
MKFTLTPDEAQAIAEAVHADLKRKHFAVEIEQPLTDDAPIPTLLAERSGLSVAVEAQRKPKLTPSIRELAVWTIRERKYSQVYVATDIDATLSARVLKDFKSLGVGLLVVDGNEVEITHQAQIPALVVTPDPNLKLGRCKTEVHALVKQFNEVDRKAALREMCDLVERETDKLCRKLASKAWFDLESSAVDAMDWSEQINISASKKRYTDGREPVIGSALKTDLDSFRSARNLVNHKVKNKKEKQKLELQFVERMMMGPRLTHELLAAQRGVKG